VTDGFVSYSRHDREAVLPGRAAAEALDRSLWFDGADIPTATLWRDELADAIAASDTFVCSSARTGSAPTSAGASTRCGWRAAAP
jgi:hypothetical protein